MKQINFKLHKHKYYPKNRTELKKLITRLLNKYGEEADLNVINVSNIDVFNRLFAANYIFNGDVSEWNVSNGYNFDNMFEYCYDFDSNLANWDTSNAIYISYLFYFCKKFNANLSNWNVSNVKFCIRTFSNCSSFNADLSKWKFHPECEPIRFAEKSLLEIYPERLPARFRGDYL